MIVLARTLDKAQANLAGMPRVESVALELMDPASINAFARTFSVHPGGILAGATYPL